MLAPSYAPLQTGCLDLLNRQNESDVHGGAYTSGAPATGTAAFSLYVLKGVSPLPANLTPSDRLDNGQEGHHYPSPSGAFRSNLWEGMWEAGRALGEKFRGIKAVDHDLLIPPAQPAKLSRKL